MPAATMKRKPARAKSSVRGTGSAAGISDAAVKSATGRTWDQWLAILDTAGAKRMNHKEIVAHLAKHHGAGPWWRQMVTVAYEQSRGLRAKHQRPDGYQVSRSKTINAPLARLYKAWTDARSRARWLDDPGFTVRTATPDKSLRITWVDGTSSVETMFYSKGAGKTQVVVQHSKLGGAKIGQRMKSYWTAQLEQLAECAGA